MSQYRFGTFTSPATAAAQTITLGFEPSSFKLTNYTGFDTDTVVSEAQYFDGMTAGYALIKTTTTDSDLVGKYQAPSILTSNGFTVFSTGGSWTNTIIGITDVSSGNPGIVTTASAHGYSDGDIVTLSGIVGTTQLNTVRVNVIVKDSDEFYLYDLFGNPIDTTVMGTYVSGGECNLISSSATTPVGLQQDEGSAGIILGTSLFRNNADVFYWEAWLQTPTGW